MRKEGMAFKNLFVNAKGKDTTAPQLKPIGLMEAKDLFKDAKNQILNDVLTQIYSLGELNEFVGNEQLKLNEYVSLEHGS